MDEQRNGSTPMSALLTALDGSAAADLEQIGSAVDTARAQAGAPVPPPVSSAQFLVALALLRGLREHLAGWEPELIDAARAHGASWAELAPALGVASRQAAERRALRLRPGDGSVPTGDARVSAERDRRAGQRAVDVWARERAAELRQLAGQITALADLPGTADPDLDALRTALGSDDPAALLTPLANTRAHLDQGHRALAQRLDTLGASTDAVRRDTNDQRHNLDT